MQSRQPPAASPPNTLQRPSKVQMADIARMAGVSVSTVSRALAGSALVNAQTRAQIEELARSLKYSINVGAQNLRRGHNNTVAVIVPFDPRTRRHLSDPFYLSLIGSLADALTERGHDMLLTRIDAERLDQVAELHHTGRAMGIVLIGQWHQHDQLNAMAAQGVPFVVWGARLPQQRYVTVGSDNVGGGRLATEHLLAGGDRRLLFMGPTDLPEISQRLQGFRDAHAAAGLGVQASMIRSVPYVPEAIQREVQQLLKQRVDFDAIVCASDLMAMQVISALRLAGLRVPEDVRVVGYDDIALAAHFHPPLSTVRQPIEAAGRALVASLLSQLRGEPLQSTVLPTEFVARDSSRPA